MPGGSVAHGLSLGTLVQVQGGDSDGALGQLVSYDDVADLFSVALISGIVVDLRPHEVNVPEFKRPGQGGDDSSFDLLLGPLRRPDLLGKEISTCLFEKGFCVVKIVQDVNKAISAVDHVGALGRAGQLQRLPEEVEEGHLGTGVAAKVAFMDPRAAEPLQPTLKANDNTFDFLFSCFQPYSEEVLGKPVEERSLSLVSLELGDEEEAEYPHPVADDRILGDFLQLWRQQLVRAIHFMGPGDAFVLLESTSSLPVLREPTLTITAGYNTILLYRPDCFSFACSEPEGTLRMTTTFLSSPPNLVLTSWGGHAGLISETRLGPPGPSTEKLVNVMQLATRLASNFDDSGHYEAGLVAACDTSVEMPWTRFDYTIYYCPDETIQPWQMSCKHMGYVEGIELFDNKYFDISVNESKNMDPMQRQVLEVGSVLLGKMGITKKSSARAPIHAGCSVGLDKDDWNIVPKEPEADGGNNVQAIISNRFSFLFNLRGANYVADTACSASLCATHLGKLMLLDPSDPLDFHLALGIHQCLSPIPFVGCSQTKMVSPLGRCMTFDASAAGYMRADGCSGLILNHANLPESRLCVLRGSSFGQNGRSATLTAPNGVAQEEVIWRALRDARISPSESCVWNCHGTGTSLGDPIEVGAVRRIMSKEPRTTALSITTNKTCVGHLEGGAAMTTLVAVVLQVKHSKSLPIVHLKQLNPHLESSLFDAFFSDELSSYNYGTGNIDISSFGFGGTNGHAVFWGEDLSKRELSVETQIQRMFKSLAPPEVRPTGPNPDYWESDLPDKDIQIGDRYTVVISDDATLPVKYEKQYEVEDVNDRFYCIVGNFKEEEEKMANGDVPGQRTCTVEIPSSGRLEFNFLVNGDMDQAVCPAYDQCTSKTASIIAPSAETNSWLVLGEPGVEVRIDLFVWNGKYSVMWLC